LRDRGADVSPAVADLAYLLEMGNIRDSGSAAELGNDMGSVVGAARTVQLAGPQPGHLSVPPQPMQAIEGFK
jgi:hypothetical protein